MLHHSGTPTTEPAAEQAQHHQPTADQAQHHQPTAEQLQHRKPPLRFDAASRPDLALPSAVLPTCNVPHGFGEELAELVAEGIGLPPSADPKAALAKLHTLPGGQTAQNQRLGRNDRFQKRWHNSMTMHPEFRARLDALLRRFVREAVADALESERHGWGELVYQAIPSLRIHMPNTRTLSVLHKDFDYFHQAAEVNIWVPLVPEVGGTNSLYCESAAGAGDYQPFAARFGDLVRFYGNQHTHFTRVNETDVTRVSLDLRVVPAPLYVDDWASPKGVVAFRLGGYYASTDVRSAERVRTGELGE